MLRQKNHELKPFNTYLDETAEAGIRCVHAWSFTLRDMCQLIELSVNVDVSCNGAAAQTPNNNIF